MFFSLMPVIKYPVSCVLVLEGPVRTPYMPAILTTTEYQVLAH
jgi:hypothetical protein